MELGFGTASTRLEEHVPTIVPQESYRMFQAALTTPCPHRTPPRPTCGPLDDLLVGAFANDDGGSTAGKADLSLSGGWVGQPTDHPVTIWRPRLDRTVPRCARAFARPLGREPTTLGLEELGLPKLVLHHLAVSLWRL